MVFLRKEWAFHREKERREGTEYVHGNDSEGSIVVGRGVMGGV